MISMEEPQKKISYRNGDRASTPALILLYLIVAVVLHLLFALCFRSAPMEQKPALEEQRTVRMIETENIDSGSTGYRLADPTVFVHGSDGTGYSRTDRDDAIRNPALSVKVAPLVLPDQISSQTGTLLTQPLGAPDRKELPHISANAPLLGAPDKIRQAAEKKEILYPRWLDLSGSDLNRYFSETQLNGLQALKITGQSTFRIKNESDNKLQPHVILLRSCGKASADIAAKTALEQALTDPSFRKSVPHKNGLVVRLCWSQLAETPREEDLPALMFSEEKEEKK